MLESSGGPAEHLESLHAALAGLTPEHRIAFVAALTERRVAVVHPRERDTRPRPDRPNLPDLVDLLWARAGGDPIPYGTYEEDLDRLAILVDPDNFHSADHYRALRVVGIALRCALADGELDAARDVAHVSLDAAARSILPEDFEAFGGMRRRWATPEVRQEVAFQSDALGRLREAGPISRPGVAALRLALASAASG